MKQHTNQEKPGCCDNICILNPVGKCRIIWDLFVGILLLYTCIEIPFTLAFSIELALDAWVGIVALSVDILLLTDILLNFFTAYFDDDDHLYLNTSKCDIFMRYCCGQNLKRYRCARKLKHHCCEQNRKYCCCEQKLKHCGCYLPRGWFWIDLITSLPFEFFPWSYNQPIGTLIKAHRMLRFLRIIKLIRLIKMMRSFNDLAQRLLLHEWLLILRFCKCIFIIVIFAHYCACIWYGIGDHCLYDSNSNHQMCNNSSWLDGYFGFEFEESTLSQRYSVSFYWSVVTLLTTGYGDITATNMLEQWVASGCILIGTGFFGYFLDTIRNLVSNHDDDKAQIRSKLEKAKKFCQMKKLPSDLSFAVIAHTKYHLKNNLASDDAMDILNNLPKHLKGEVNVHMGGTEILNRFKLFKDLDYETIGLISLKMKSISCNQDYVLFRANEYGNEIYIQRKGTSILYDKHRDNNGNYKEVCKFEENAVFGQESLRSKRRKYSVQCKTWCEFYVINCDDIRQIIEKQYPNRCRVKFEFIV